MLKLLVVEPQSPVMRIDGKWFRTPNPFAMDHQRIEHLTRQRELEWEQMQEYLANRCCSMQFLAAALDDNTSGPCGRCAFCLQRPVLSTGDGAFHAPIAARRFVRQSEMPLQLKKQWDLSALGQYGGQFGWRGLNIRPSCVARMDACSPVGAEPVWGALVAEGKAAGRFDDKLVEATADLVANRWPDAAKVRWVTCIPSLRHPELVPDFARRLAEALGLPFRDAVKKVREQTPRSRWKTGSISAITWMARLSWTKSFATATLCFWWTTRWIRHGR